MSPLAFRYSGEEVPAGGAQGSRGQGCQRSSMQAYSQPRQRPLQQPRRPRPLLTVGLGREVAAGEGVQEVDEELARLPAHDRAAAVGVERDDVEEQGEVDAEVLVVLVRQLAQHAQRELGPRRLAQRPPLQPQLPERLRLHAGPLPRPGRAADRVRVPAAAAAVAPAAAGRGVRPRGGVLRAQQQVHGPPAERRPRARRGRARGGQGGCRVAERGLGGGLARALAVVELQDLRGERERHQI